MKKTIPIIAFCLLSLACYAGKKAENPEGYGDAVVTKVISVYDGDTFRCNIESDSPIIGNNTQIRIKGIDTPELMDDRKSIKELAYKAKDFTAEKLQAAKVIMLRNMERDKYSRILADVEVDGQSLAKMLLENGLAKPYSGGKKPIWTLSNVEKSTTLPKPKKVKWIESKRWKKLKKGMSIRQVHTLLGKPKYIQVFFNDSYTESRFLSPPQGYWGRQEVIWYYHYSPDVNDKPTISDLKTVLMPGSIAFCDTGPTSKMVYRVITWHNPVWEVLKHTPLESVMNQENKGPKLKYTAKWQNPNLWKKLKKNVSERYAQRLLGKPLVEYVYEYTEWIPNIIVKIWDYDDKYGDKYAQIVIISHGMSKSRTGPVEYEKPLIKGWTEPFWPEVEKELYRIDGLTKKK